MFAMSFVILCLLTMPLRKRPAASTPPLLDEALHRELVQCGTKTGLITAVTALGSAGCLADEFLNAHQGGTLRRRLQAAQVSHAKASTPYGTVVQSMPMPDIPELDLWEYCHPLALIYHLSVISPVFAELMATCGTPGLPLRIVLYIDEICPGNPLRPEKSRTLQAIYWAFADWPQWVLQRTAAWPVFGTMRSSLVAKLPGKVSQLMKMVLHIFFSAVGASFTLGVTIVRAGGERIIRTACFSGFIADEKAHNQIVGSKGASGTRPCSTCVNVFGRMSENRIPDGCVHYKSVDPSKFKFHTNESVYVAYDAICNATDEQRGFISQSLGINCNPHGLLHDTSLRAIYRPVDHTLRDHQHILTSDGVANKQVAHCIRALIGCRITIAMVSSYVTSIKLPKAHGKTDASWVSRKRLGKKMNSLASFSSIMLSLVPILVSFFMEMEATSEDHPLKEHAECMILLRHIMGLVMLGPVDAMGYIDLLRELIAKHAAMFAKLYPGAQTPKFHQLFHICDNAEYLGRLLSCFVLERKHRTTKRAALFVFRHIDNTVVKDLVNRQCEAICGRTGSLFSERFIVAPKRFVVPGCPTFTHGKTAVLPCGSVSGGDIVSLDDGRLGEVVTFWSLQGDATIVVRLSLFQSVGSLRWKADTPVSIVVDSACILAPVMWRRIGDAEIHVLPPFRLVLREVYH